VGGAARKIGSRTRGKGEGIAGFSHELGRIVQPSKDKRDGRGKRRSGSWVWRRQRRQRDVGEREEEVGALGVAAVTEGGREAGPEEKVGDLGVAAAAATEGGRVAGRGGRGPEYDDDNGVDRGRSGR
jgi:hypothetical protein